MATGDYYDILGVSKTATPDEIKKAFRKKAAELHPDNQDTGDEAKFKQLVAAYEVLSDDNKKALYDRYGEDGLKRGGAGAGGGFGQEFDMSAFSDLGEIFEYFFSGGMRGGGQRRSGPQRGSDLRYDMEIQFLEAVFGVEKKIHIKHLRTCETCKGSGGAAGCEPVTCTGCGGHGQVRQTTSTFIGHFSQIVPCPNCAGEGVKVEKPCADCAGKGLQRKERTLELKIPAGVDNGSRIRVTGEGDSGKRGAPTGDLYVILNVRPHEKFQREGTTILLKQPISMSMAALGGDMLVDTVGGKRLLKIPAATTFGTVITMKGEGVPQLSNPEKRGLQQVVLVIDTPTKLSDEEKDLYRKLAELRGEQLTVPENERPQTTEHAKDKDKDQKEHHSIFDAIAGVFKGKNATGE